jgi:hypothetical protein
MHELNEHPKLKDEMVFLLQKWSKLANHYQQRLCNPSLKVWYNLILLNSSNLDMEGLVSQESGLTSSWNNTCVVFTMGQPLL